jgi:hypothetical protein
LIPLKIAGFDEEIKSKGRYAGMQQEIFSQPSSEEGRTMGLCVQLT